MKNGEWRIENGKLKFLTLCLLVVSLNATSLSELFNAIKQTPDTKIDNVLVKEMKTNKKDVVSKLYPKVELFSSYEHFSTPANVKPMPPTCLLYKSEAA